MSAGGWGHHVMNPNVLLNDVLDEVLLDATLLLH